MEPRIRDLEMLYKGLADATRLRIVGLLAGGEVCVCHIHESLQIPQPTVSRHLAYLRRHGLVETRRDGLWVHYRLACPPDATVRAALEAAAHAVGHVPAMRGPEARLARRVKRRAKPRLLPMLSCCAEPR